jgi:hypothetical protein
MLWWTLAIDRRGACSAVHGRVMAVAWYRFTATFGRRWGGYLAIVLLIGMIGGIAMASVAAARRTQPRIRRSWRAPTRRT